MHVSIPVENTVEFINLTQVSPLISKCQIKVLYIGQNRNGTFISKEVATEMGKKLPGSPIVGYFNPESGDFEEHNREIEIKDDKFAIIDTTRPYGFVDVNAKVWFQKFLDDGEVEREYLVTEGYIWSDVYPESARITEHGNNHSMELNKESVKGNWTNGFNSNERFFIINEAIIEKLCILGENFEPCFEGSQIKAEFSLETEFAKLKDAMFSMINELKNTLNEGGSDASMVTETLNEVVEEVIDAPEVEETPATEEVVEETPTTEEVVEETPEDFKKKDEEEEKENSKDDSNEDNTSENEDKSEGEDSTEDEDDDKKKKKYNLEEVVEYSELVEKFEELSQSYAALEQRNNELVTEIKPLKAFKLEKEREAKQAMIDSFFMLSEEDKSDVVANIDTYSLEDIEAKLAVICVRNKVNFNLGEDQDKNPDMTFNLSAAAEDFSDTPAWVKAVKKVASNRQ